jgi:hypothetical protein
MDWIDVMRHFAACLAAGLVAMTPAAATEFRCYPPDPAGFYGLAAASPDGYIIVRGRFSFDMDLLPYGGPPTVVANIRPIAARFSGERLGPGGFAPDSFDLTIQPSCIRVTCTYMLAETQVIAFVRQTPEGLVLDADPCLAPVFAADDATAALLIRLAQQVE